MALEDGDRTVGQLVGIHITETAGGPMRDVPRVVAIAGQGLRGDRYQTGRGTFSGRRALVDGARALSLIDTADIARCRQRLGREIVAGRFRRNLVIDGLDILALRDARLAIGDVVLRLVGRCAPCGYLSRQLDADMRTGLYRGGGMRACIEQGGTLIVGASVAVWSR